MRDRSKHNRTYDLRRMVDALEPRILLTRLLGIDVSTYQPSVNWATVSTVKQFAYVRATAGLNTNDDQFANNVNLSTGVAARGMYVGFYHYAYYDLDATHTADAEADHFFNQVKNYLIPDGKHLEPMLDVEEPLRAGWTGTDLSNWVTEWCNRVSGRALTELGLVVTPIVYAGAFNAGGTLNTTIPEYFPDVIPSWPTTLPNPQTAAPSNIGKYTNWSFWQYAGSATGTCPGVGNGTTTACDLDVFQGDSLTIQDYVIGSAGRWADGSWVKVNNSAGVKAWNDDTANSASPYNDTSVTVANGTIGKILQGPFYGNSNMNYQVQFTGGTTGWVQGLSLATVTPGAPANPSPSGTVSPGTLPASFTWTAATNATSYDVYLDGVFKANVTTNAWAHGTVSVGAHTWQVKAKNAELTTTGASWSFTLNSVGPLTTPVNISPPDGSIQNTRPVTFDWADVPSATKYDLYLTSNPTTPLAANITASTWTGLATGLNLIYSWYVVAKDNVGDTITGPTWSVMVDLAAPTAALVSGEPDTGDTFFDFEVNYTDITSTVDISTLDSDDLAASGPNGSIPVTYEGVSDPTNNGKTRIATYRIAAPGGFWNDVDNGTYTITQVAGQVKDLAGNARSAGVIGTYAINDLATAWMNNTTLTIAFDGTSTPVQLSADGDDASVTKNGNTTDFSEATAIAIVGSDSDDLLQVNSPPALPLSFGVSGGNDTLEVTGGSYTIAGDLGATASNIGVQVDNGANAVFSTSQHLRSISVDGTASLAPGGDKALEVGSLVVSGKLDLADNGLVWDYTGSSPLGGWSSGAYTGLTGEISTARAGGAWTGSGVTTSQSPAISPSWLATIGVSEASSALGLSGGQTALWFGMTVDSTAVLARYTYAGDANLDGVINGDDYFAIDSGIATQATGYASGDFNYDGRVDADDYFVIDSNYPKASAPMASAPPLSFTPSAAKNLFATSTITSAYQRLIEPDSGLV